MPILVPSQHQRFGCAFQTECLQHLIKVATVSQGRLNEAPAHPREIFKPVITHSAYSFIPRRPAKRAALSV
jgi:DNA repair protein RadC